jgi:hypothetical protein
MAQTLGLNCATNSLPSNVFSPGRAEVNSQGEQRIGRCPPLKRRKETQSPEMAKENGFALSGPPEPLAAPPAVVGMNAKHTTAE